METVSEWAASQSKATPLLSLKSSAAMPATSKACSDARTLGFANRMEIGMGKKLGNEKRGGEMEGEEGGESGKEAERRAMRKRTR